MKTTKVMAAVFLAGAFLFVLPGEDVGAAGKATPGHSSTSANTGTPASAQPVGNTVTGESAGNSYQCFVGTKDAGVQTTTVQAESENAAKVAAVKQFGSRAFGLVSVQCTPGAPAAASGGAVILSRNPQLSKI